MLEARKTGFWRSRYEVTLDGHPVTTWEGKFWRGGGEFLLEGRPYQVHGNAWGSKFSLTDQTGAPLASAERVGRKRWTVTAGAITYRFERRSFWTGEQQLVSDEGPVGSVRKTSMWRSDAVADLPGLPLPLQVFVLGVVITMWNADSAAAAGAAS